ncbi:MAG: Caspase domain protein [Candidatus Scalindua rubra]|uniref:Caspase domain protein n=1 Tax=Candidatus Scalindua rubra TaxID=1872076 RepID=A0A1E3XEQ2_9BACT|nr:MAG: Caspase domain protein [Candidatus Scalindua rubra]
MTGFTRFFILKVEDISRYTGGLKIEDAIKNPPPQVTILSPEEGDAFSNRTVTLRVQIKDIGGGIGDIRIYHNGKLVESKGVYRLAKSEMIDKQIKVAKAEIGSPYQSAKRGFELRKIVWDDNDKKDFQIVNFTPLKGTVEKTYKITLINGENTISASAFNGTNTVMSAMESIKVKADIPERRPELFAIIMGNDHFKSSTVNLSFAIKDAEDFSNLINEVAAPIYKKVNIKILTNTKKTAIIKTLTAMKTKMKPEDVFIFFAATHGWTYDDIYYLYTSDFDGNLLSKQSSISSVEIMEFSKWLPALKQVFILDTCQAGGVKTAVSGLYDARISVLAKRSVCTYSQVQKPFRTQMITMKVTVYLPIS